MIRSWLGLTCFVALIAQFHPSASQAAPCVPSTFAGAWKGEVTLCQNWNADEQQDFWFLPQGSLILPYDWFVSLEQKDSQVPFIDPVHMDGFRYLPQRPTKDDHGLYPCPEPRPVRVTQPA